jgi:hypothetical protein
MGGTKGEYNISKCGYRLLNISKLGNGENKI